MVSVPDVPPRITVVGSANIDHVARCQHLPRPGETVTDAAFERVPGGKGANQAVAAARLGARVRFVGRIGSDDLVLRSLVQAGTAASVSGFVQHAVAVALDDVAGWGAMLAEALRATGGELSERERAWADEVLGTGTQPTA